MLPHFHLDEEAAYVGIVNLGQDGVRADCVVVVEPQTAGIFGGAVVVDVEAVVVSIADDAFPSRQVCVAATAKS